MRRTTLPSRAFARSAKAAAVLAATAIGVMGLPAAAFAATGTLSVTSTNGLAGVSSASNTASATVIFSTSDSYLYSALTSGQFTATFTRHGSGNDQIPASITSAAPAAPAPATSFTTTVDLTSANPGAYDISITGPSTTGDPQAQVDTCSSCFTVLSSPPHVSGITPTAIAQGATKTLNVTGTGFARGNYPAPSSNYDCASCTGAPKLELRQHGVSAAVAGATFSDPLNGSNQQVPVPATSATITKVVTLSGSVPAGVYDVYVANTDGSSDTLANAVTVDPAPTISAVSAQSSVTDAPAGTTLGRGSSGGTITVTGTNFPSDITGSISFSGQTSDVTYSFVRDSATQVRFTGVALTSTATLGSRTLRLSSPGDGGAVTSTAFSVTAAPAPASVTLPDSTVGRYGQGARGVHVVVTGTGFTAGNGANGAQVVLLPSTGITVVSQTATATAVTATIDLAANTPTGTAAVEVRVQNPDGGVAACSTACTFGVGAAPQITGVTANSEARGQSHNVTLTGTNLADATNKAAPTVTIANATHGTIASPVTSATSVTVPAVLASSSAVGPQDIAYVNGDDKGRTTCVGCYTITSLGVTGTSNNSSLNDHTATGIVVTGNGFDPTATVDLVKTGSGSATVPPIAGVVTTAPVESTAGSADGTQLTASFPLTGVDPGTYAFRVTNPDGTPFPGVGQGGLFTVVANAPTITTVAPSSRGAGAVNQSIVITGTGFAPHATVAFSNAAVHIDSVSHDSATQVTVVVHIDQDAAPDSSGTVSVTNTDTAAASKPFTIVTGPHISSVSPASRGQGAAGTTITLSGPAGTFPTAAHASVTFAGGSGVTASGFTFAAGSAGTPPVVQPTPDTLAGALSVSSGATVGNDDVVLVDTSTGGRYVCVACFAVHAKPTLTSVTPFDGAVGTSVPVTLAGTGFAASPTVTATGGVTVSAVTQTSPNSVTATFAIPAGATRDSLVDVTLTNADGGFVTLVGGFHLFGKPDAPTIGTATPGNAQATVTWTAPAFNGGSAITGYTVTASPGGATVGAAAGATQATVTGLTNGTSYTFTVHAANAAGNGPESASTTSTTPRTVPGKPTSVSAVPSDRSATVSWAAPASNGGSAITGYTVTAAPGGATATVDGATTSAAVSGLTNGTAYTFTVHATNVAGDGAESDPSASVTPRTTPGAPTAVMATPGNGKATVSWTAPASNGGSAITGYTVTATPGGATATVSAPTTSTDVTGLTNGTAYTFTVHATNVAGNGPESSASSSTTPRTVPGAPTAVSATAGDASAVVSWTAPASDGGSGITGYTVTSSPGGFTATAGGSATSATVTGLTNGTAYTFTVHATNAAGSGAESAASAQVTPATNATAPSGVSAVPGNGKATVSWTAPTDNGGSAITSYTVTSTPGSITATVSAPATTNDVTGLTNGTSYTFTVHATNGTGPGPESAPSNAVTPRTVPGKPTAVTATPSNGAAGVSWSAPASNGGATITGYTVTASPGGATTDVNGTTTSATVSGLTNGTAYTFSVHATNAAGSSAESDPSSAVTPATTPDAPTAVSAVPGDASAVVSWTAPGSNGGSAVTGYTVTSSPGGFTGTAGAGATSTSVSGLSNGTAYTFTVHATNAVGNGPESAPSGAVTPRAVPGAPTGVQATAGNASASVSWTAPADNGATITSYTVTASPGGKTATVNGNPAGTTVVVTGLTNGTAYTFTVVATNVAGDGPASGASSGVTPSTVPGQATGISAVGGNGQATVSWTPPTDDGGSPITGYTVTSSPGAFTAHAAGNATQATVTGLTNGATYTFTVVATNAQGDGPTSDSSAPITLATAPDAPTGVSATAGDSQATVTWTAPSSNGGATISSYTVTASPGGATDQVVGSPAPTMATVTGLTNGTAYTFTVVAHNSAGDSPASPASTAVTPATTPTAPRSVAASAGDRTVTVTWSAPASDGGSAVTHYSVTLNGGAPYVVASTARSVTFTGLANATSYTPSVVAQNAKGNSPAASAGAVVPYGTTTTSLNSVPSKVVYGTYVTFSGVVHRTDSSAPYDLLALYMKNDAGKVTIVGFTTPSSTGAWSIRLKPGYNGLYQAVYGGDDVNDVSWSVARRVLVAAHVSAYAPSGSHLVNQVITGAVAPAKPGKVVALYRVSSTGSLVKLGTATLSSKSTYRFSVRLPKGITTLEVVIGATPGNIAGAVKFRATRT